MKYKLALSNWLDILIAFGAGLTIYTQSVLNRFYYINSDEGNSVKYAHLSILEMLRELSFDAHLPAYPILLKTIDLLVGINLWTAYIVNGLLFSVMIYFIFYGRSTWFTKVASAIFFILNPFFLELFTELRPYPLFIVSFSILFTMQKQNRNLERCSFIGLAASHHLGFVTAIVYAGWKTIQKYRKTKTLPWFEIIVCSVLFPLFITQTQAVMNESRYITLSQFSFQEEFRRVLLAAEYFTVGTSDYWPLFPKQYSYYFISGLVCLSLLNFKYRLFNFEKFVLSLLPVASLFIINTKVLGVQYFVGFITVSTLLFINFTLYEFRIRKLGWIILAAAIILTSNSSIRALKGQEYYYKLNYLEALKYAYESDVDDIILATLGVRGASLTTVELLAPKYSKNFKIHDLFDNFQTGLYTSDEDGKNKVRQRLVNWFENNPGKKALLIYSSGPCHDLYKVDGIKLVSGPWEAHPGDLVSVVLSKSDLTEPTK